MKIIGAGLAGLLSAHMLPEARVHEACEELKRGHFAVLRHRSNNISAATGVPFKEIKVVKSIWKAVNNVWQGEHAKPDIQLCNLYARKVAGMVCDRSIWTADGVAKRWLAPDNFINKMAGPIMDRIEFSSKVDSDFLKRQDEPIISTMPMPVLAKMLGIKMPNIRNDSTPITVKRFKVPANNIYQTIYFPDPNNPVYRATLHEDLLIVEGVKDKYDIDWREWVGASFGLEEKTMLPIGVHEQKYGKITPIDDDFRKSFILHVTMKYNIWSVGRFATWRNLLLDDVHDDILKIKEMMSQHKYDIRLGGLNES